jgi:processive 1,2-diacylglycerol beta-glucosyltransferase
VEDVLDYTPKAFRLTYDRFYVQITRYMPHLWGYFYSQTDQGAELAGFTNRVRKLVENVSTRELQKVINHFGPDVIICTHFLPLEMLLRLRRKERLARPIYCVVTDISAHTFWIYTNIEGYFVPTTHAKQQLQQSGVSADQIWVSGIPIDPSIAQMKVPAVMKHKYQLASDGHIITVFGGGVSNDHIHQVVKDLLATDIHGTLLVVAGRNKSLVEALADLRSSATLQLQVLGFVTYVDDLVAASDIVITKPGGLIMSEVLARGVPLVVIDPIPGQEEWNADYIVSQGAGIQLRLAGSVATAVQSLLQNGPRHAQLRQNAQAAGHPQAALTVAKQVMANLQLEAVHDN